MVALDVIAFLYYYRVRSRYMRATQRHVCPLPSCGPTAIIVLVERANHNWSLMPSVARTGIGMTMTVLGSARSCKSVAWGGGVATGVDGHVSASCSELVALWHRLRFRWITSECDSSTAHSSCKASPVSTAYDMERQLSRFIDDDLDEIWSRVEATRTFIYKVSKTYIGCYFELFYL